MGNEAGRVQDPNPIVLRRQLPLLGAYVAPRTATERKLAEIWRNALGMDEEGIPMRSRRQFPVRVGNATGILIP